MAPRKDQAYYESFPKFVGFLFVAVALGLIIQGIFNVADGSNFFARLAHSIIYPIVLAVVIALGGRWRAGRQRDRKRDSYK